MKPDMARLGSLGSFFFLTLLFLTTLGTSLTALAAFAPLPAFVALTGGCHVSSGFKEKGEQNRDMFHQISPVDSIPRVYKADVEQDRKVVRESKQLEIQQQKSAHFSLLQN